MHLLVAMCGTSFVGQNVYVQASFCHDCVILVRYIVWNHVTISL